MGKVWTRTLTTVDDVFLVNQILNGNLDAYKLLVLRYQRPLFKFLSIYPISQAQIEEIAQEAFLRAYKSLDQFDSAKSSFASWLFTIAKNLSLNELNKHSRKLEVQLNEADNESLSQLPDTKLNPHERLERSNLKEKIADALSLVPNEFRNALVLSYIQDLSLEEIAVVEECSVGTVKSRVYRGKKRLLEILTKWEMNQ